MKCPQCGTTNDEAFVKVGLYLQCSARGGGCGFLDQPEAFEDPDDSGRMDRYLGAP